MPATATALRGSSQAELPRLAEVAAEAQPVTEVVVRLDKAVLKGWAINDPAYHNATILKHGCELDTDGRTVCSYLLAYLGKQFILYI